MGDLSSEDREYDGGARGEFGRGCIASRPLLTVTEGEESRRGGAVILRVVGDALEGAVKSSHLESLIFPLLSLVPEHQA